MSELKQPEVNIGLTGHVDSGKTSVVQQLTGEWTDTHSEELKRGITMKIGYADAKFYKCKEKNTYTTNKKECKNPEFLRKVSFVDCPGHEIMTTVTLSGTSIMDGALLIISANEECPQTQTREHLAALSMTGIENIVIVQTKIDLVTKKQAKENYKQIKEFVKGTTAENAPIIPVSSHHNINFSELIKAIEENIKTPKRDHKKPGKMQVARSFDINKPGTKVKDLKGGVIGGSMIHGTIKKGDKIQITPGIIKGKEHHPIETKVVSLFIKEGEIKEATPGGLTAIQTEMEPSMTKGDRLIGSIIGKPGELPPVKTEITVKTHLLNEEIIKQEITPLKQDEPLVINSGTSTVPGKVEKIEGEREVKISLRKPIAIGKGSRVAISRRSGVRWGLMGYGVVQ